MRMRSVMAALALGFVWGFLSPAAAQKKPPKPPPAPHANGNKGAGNKNPNANKPDPVKELERFQQMSPQQREKELAKLPPQRREHIEQQMAKLDSLSPDDRARMLNRLETMQRLTPARRQAVNDELKYIRSLPTPHERKARLFSPAFSEQYTPEEQKVIRDSFPVGRQGPDGKNP